MKRTKFLSLLLLGLLCSVGNAWGDTAYGFENNKTSESGYPTSAGDGSRSISSSIKRTGNYSLEQNNNNTSAKLAKIQNLSVSFTGKLHYVHYIAYLRKNTSNDVTLNSHCMYAGSEFGKVSPSSALTSSWSRITNKAQRTGNTQSYSSVEIRFQTTTSTVGDKVYIDDVVAYVTDSDVPTDLTAPSSATSATATASQISWSNGTDSGTGATGIQNTLIWKRTSGSSNDLSLNDQGIYSLTATEGPSTDQSGHWTLISASVAADATSYSGTFTSGDVYAIVHRDLAYNYSSPTYVTIIDESADPEVTAVTINGEAISASDLATLTAEKEVTIDGSTMNGLGNIVLTMSKGDAPTITRTISSGVATYTYTLNAEEYTININYGERIFGDAEGSVVYYSKNSTNADGAGTKSLTANGINFVYPSKTFGYGEGSVTIGSDIYQPIKLSTGEAVTVTFPSGKKATKIIVYGWSSAGNGWLKTLSETSSENFIFNNVAAGDANLFYATNETTDIYPSIYEYDLTNYGGIWESAYFFGAATSGQPFVVMDFVFANAPIITTQPTSASYVKNAAATDLSVAAISSDANDCTYQWYSCSDANKTGAAAIGGKTTSSLSISTTTTGVYYYFCRVTDGNGTTDSEVAKITVTGAVSQSIFSYTVTSSDVSTYGKADKNTTITASLTASGTIGGTCNFKVSTDNSGEEGTPKGYFETNSGNSVYVINGAAGYVYITLAGDNKFQEGDVISIYGSVGTKGNGFNINTSNSTSGALASSTYSSTSYGTVTATVDAARSNVSTLYIMRTSSATRISSISVTRPSKYKLAVSAAEWATLYLDFPAKVPTGLDGAYYVSGVDNGSLALASINAGDVIPAFTGIIVNADANDYVFAASNETPISVGTNLLHGERDGSGYTVGSGKHYHLSYDYIAETTTPDYSTIGFYYGAEGGVPFVISQPNKAYLVIPESSPAPARFLLNEEENNATNIKSVEDNADVVKFIENGQLLIKKEGVVYDALGHKIR